MQATYAKGLGGLWCNFHPPFIHLAGVKADRGGAVGCQIGIGHRRTAAAVPASDLPLRVGQQPGVVYTTRILDT